MQIKLLLSVKDT